MFHQAHHFSIHGGQFIIKPESTGSLEPPLNQNSTITYEKIKLATPVAPTVFTGREGLVGEAVQELSKKNQAHIAILGICSDASSLIQVMLQVLGLSVTEGHDPYKALQKYLEHSQDPMLLVLDNFETPWNTNGDQMAVQNLIEWILDQEPVSIVLDNESC
ncbi:hypothetical protein BT96DRAFT_922484 [Gymnopus androsaceus JB14]|uniref:Uncharacterized protein n=1 Tax=Gymnopus androsaceus JB14 TaxID=1447944 RepID=A0A6A4HCA1_9AGAR|nr:hypothetical protein BT96DRAFT_922484 [Gymnopus androsaceus JB14]